MEPEVFRFILDPYTVARTVCFMFTRDLANGVPVVAYYRLEVIQRFGSESYEALLRETESRRQRCRQKRRLRIDEMGHSGTGNLRRSALV